MVNCSNLIIPDHWQRTGERSREELAALQRIIMHHQIEKRKSFVFARQYIVQEQPLCQPITITIAMAKWEFLCLKTKQSYN